MPRPGEPGQGRARPSSAGPARRSGAPRLCLVTEVVDLTPRLRRVCFRSDDLVGVASAGPDQRVTIVLPDGGSFGPEGVDSPEYAQARRRRRTYTLVALDSETGTAAIDLVRHGTGVAGRWVERVRPGDDFVLSGPMGKVKTAAPVGHHLLIADETALPAVREILASLPGETSAEVHLEVSDEHEIIDLPSAADVEVTWWTRTEHGGETGELVAGLAPHLRTAGPGIAVWVGAEAEAVARLRTHLLTEAHCDRSLLSAVAYWRRGRAET